MPPLAISEARYDQEDVSYGSIEVEAANDKDGKLVVAKIVIVPPQSSGKPVFLLDNNNENDRSVGNPLKLSRQITDDTVYDSLAGSLLCACDCSQTSLVPSSPTRKSALKRSSSTTPRRTVSFKSLEIRNYNLTLGDHPSASTGPPVMLDWNHEREEVVDLEVYERARQPRRRRRQLKLSLKERQEILTAKGFSISDISKAWEKALEIRKQRYETVMQGLFSTKMEEAWESANRKFWRLFNYE